MDHVLNWMKVVLQDAQTKLLAFDRFGITRD
jgi:hypothetical protein